jgi:hypothetical protein
MLNAGDIGKFGKASNSYSRYSPSDLNNMVHGGVKQIYFLEEMRLRFEF